MSFKIGILEGEIDKRNEGLEDILNSIEGYRFIMLKTTNFRQENSVADTEEYLDFLAEKAKKMEAYFAAGVIDEKADGKIYKTGIVFGPEGKPVLKQRQLFLNREDKKKGYSPGIEINIARTNIANIGFISGEDCWQPEVGRFLALEGVDLVIAYSFNKGGFYWKQLAGIWSQVQQNQFIALEAGYGGRDLIHAPCEITPYRTGILAPLGKKEEALQKSPARYLSSLKNQEKVEDGLDLFKSFTITRAVIELDKLKEIRKKYPLIKHLNPGLYQKSGPELLYNSKEEVGE